MIAAVRMLAVGREFSVKKYRKSDAGLEFRLGFHIVRYEFNRVYDAVDPQFFKRNSETAKFVDVHDLGLEHTAGIIWANMALRRHE